MLKVIHYLKKVLFSKERENFYYLQEEIELENQTEHHKIAYLSSYKNVG